MEQKSQVIKASLPFWWILLTVVYLASFLIFDVFRGLHGFYVEIIFKAITLVGLFVPLGLGNFVASLEGSKWLIVYPLILGTVFGGEYLLLKATHKWKLSFAIKLFFILVILCVLTFVVDFILWHCWVSFAFLIGD